MVVRYSIMLGANEYPNKKAEGDVDAGHGELRHHQPSQQGDISLGGAWADSLLSYSLGLVSVKSTVRAGVGPFSEAVALAIRAKGMAGSVVVGQ